MKELTFVTGNPTKIWVAEPACKAHGIKLILKDVATTEIQAEDGLVIAQDKAEKAFAKLQTPLVINDASWVIPGLNGFPGPYMKSMNDWLAPEDWLRLTKPLKDRRIFLQQIIVFQDEHLQQSFCVDVEGTLLSEISGTSDFPNMTVVSFGKSNASHEQGFAALRERHNVWHEFAAWYENYQP
jgi:inosine/xanthosine triphosphate pyrophosphatase family protein